MCLRQRLSVLATAALLVVGLTARGDAVPPQAPWTVRDIGPRLAPSLVDVDPRGFWTLRASNGDVSLNADSCFFVSQPLSGDGSILALLFGEEGGDPQFGKAGLMIRADESAGAANIFLHMTTGHGLEITYRPTARQPTFNEGADRRYGGRQFPIWLRVQREGDRFTPFASSDGFGWIQLHAPITLPGFPKDALFGIAASSLFDSPVAAAFGNVTVTPGQVSPIVQVSAGNGSVLLSWPPVSNAAGYVVRRSGLNTPGFAADLLTPDPIKETSFADTNRPNGQAVRYLVSAIVEQGGQKIEGWTNSVAATPVPTPGNLFGCDINVEATQLRGGILFEPATGIYRISGSGGDIGNTEDRGFFVSQLVKGEFQITARILDRVGARDGKAGVMVRETQDSSSRTAFLAGTAAAGVVFQYREETGGSTAFSGRPLIASADFKPPLFLRLVRRGNTITPFLSPDGTTFTPAAGSKTFDPPLPESLYVGYAITSQNAGVTAVSSFSDFTIGPPSPQ
jgi:regulation of enolase protein 1 (concanavalin A-like superfamily)